MAHAHGAWHGHMHMHRYTSLLLDAVGLAPSKDAFWSTAGANHPNPELHAIVATLSTGPVGFMDRVGRFGRGVLRCTCDEGGVLLAPSRPLTAVEAMFIGEPLDPSLSAAGGHVWATHADAAAGRFRSRLVLSIARVAPLLVKPSELYPPSTRDRKSTV